ncbi:MAG: hypothetical protein ACREOU_13020 [Candidatus Eiseniibacteriota bacterium]
MSTLARENKAEYPPLFCWVTVQAVQNPILGFSYIDQQAGPSVKGTPLQGEPTLEDAKRAVESPVVTVRMGTFPSSPLTADQIKSLCLPSPPPWYLEFFDDGTLALFTESGARTGLIRSPSLPWYLKVKRTGVPAIQVVSIEGERQPDDTKRSTLTAGVLRFLRKAPHVGVPRERLLRQSSPMPRESLDEVTARGRLIAQLDRIAAWGTDAVNAIGPDTRLLGYYIPHRQRDRWCVAFGRMSEDGAAFMTAYEALGNGPYGWPFDVHVHDPVREDRGWLKSAGQAIAVSLKQPVFSSAVDAYNCVVVPEFDGSNSVYWYPASRTPGITLLGADFRVAVSRAGEAAVEPYHKTLLRSAPGGAIVAHTHLLVQAPVPLDVSYVLMKRPPSPSLIICEFWSYFVARDGTLITLDLDREASIDDKLIEMIETAVTNAKQDHMHPI